MGNCCGCCDDEYKDGRTTGQTNQNTPLNTSTDPSQYQSASREAIAAAAERRAAEQKSKSQTKFLRKTPDVDLPENAGSGGLRWQVG